MIKKIYIILFVIIFLSLIWAVNAYSAAFVPALGGTGNSSTPSKGDLLVGSTTAIYARLGVGADGLVLKASSTAPRGISWEADLSSISTSSQLVAGQWLIASAYNTIYSTSSIPIILQQVSASGTIIQVVTSTAGNLTIGIPSNISVFTNNSGYLTALNFTTSSPVTVNQPLYWTGLNTVAGSSSQLVSGATSPITISSAGLIACATCSTSSGSISTSSIISAFNFPYWANTTGGLMGTSTMLFTSSTGGINIGTSTANTAPLTIVEGTSGSAAVLDIVSTDNDTAQIQIRNTTSSGRTFQILTTGSGCSSLLACSGLNFWDSASSTTRLSITTAGNIGIGIVSPSTKLEVVGVVSSTEVRSPSSTLINVSSTRNSASTGFDGGRIDVTNVSTTNLTIGTLNGLLAVNNGVINTTSTATSTKGVFITAPSSTDDIVMYYTDTAFTINQVNCLNKGSASGSVNFNIIHGFGAASTTNLLFANGLTCNATTTIQSNATFANASIAAGEIIRYVATTTVANVSTTNLYVDFKWR